MKAWLSSLLLLVVGVFFAASGCSKLTVNRNSTQVDASGGSGGNSAGNGGDADNGGREIIVASGGVTADGCPSTCEVLNANCGFVTDTRCGGVVKCGSCSGTDVCGGTDANRCGPVANNLPDGGACVASTCEELGASCGYVTDTKCSAVADCGQNVCPGHCTNGSCTTETCTVDPATTCVGRGYVCGQAIDNCGNVLDCGPATCPNPGDLCVQGVCGPPNSCVVDPTTTCAGRGYSCGQAADNCGHLLNCGPTTCAIPGWTCGGGNAPGVCGCTGACSQIPICASGVSTTLSGKVYDPAGRNPLYHVLVYVANAPSDPALKSFPQGVTCDVCGATAAGSPLISTPGASDPPAGEYTDVDGSFTLKNVPVGNITVVIQLGRWRRTFPVNIANPCAPNFVFPERSFTMPSTSAQGNIPLMAMVTGNADSLECVLRKIGIAQSEFTNPGQAGRIHFYLGDKAPGQAVDAATPSQTQLFTNGINAYDLTILACQGVDSDQSANQDALRNYAAAGGRVFATHRSFNWLYKNNANAAVPTDPSADNWSQVATWHSDDASSDYSDGTFPVTSSLDFTSNPKANAFQGWLSAVGALNAGAPPNTTVFVVRHDTDAISTVPGRTQQWLYRNGVGHCSADTTLNCTSNAQCLPMVCKAQPTKACTAATAAADCGTSTTCVANTCAGTNLGKQVPVHFTFNTPVNLVQDLSKTPPAVQCGRVLFSDFHISDANEWPTEYYPSQCAENVARATPSPLVCYGQPKKTCTVATQVADCGTAYGPCVSSGTCSTDADCTGACVAGKCPWGQACSSSAQCVSTCSSGVCLDPMTAQEKLLEYMLFDLGSCVPPGKTCVPKTSCPAGQDCGYAPDGCGGLVACGICPDGTSCGVGEPPVANKCGKVSCTPHKCPADVACGYVSDGCSGVTNCGMCPAGQTCNNGKCGASTCTPKSCADQGLECGQAGDTCGQVLTCPTCPANNACVSGKCVPLSCQPKTCAAQGIQCGPGADGCGNKIDSCGTCDFGDLCNYGKCVSIN